MKRKLLSTDSKHDFYISSNDHIAINLRHEIERVKKKIQHATATDRLDRWGARNVYIKHFSATSYRSEGFCHVEN